MRSENNNRLTIMSVSVLKDPLMRRVLTESLVAKYSIEATMGLKI
jgi:hypothetical protein